MVNSGIVFPVFGSHSLFNHVQLRQPSRPNYDDFSCRWRFGVEAPPLEEDEAVMVPCFTNCPSELGARGFFVGFWADFWSKIFDLIQCQGLYLSSPMPVQVIYHPFFFLRFVDSFWQPDSPKSDGAPRFKGTKAGCSEFRVAWMLGKSPCSKYLKIGIFPWETIGSFGN